MATNRNTIDYILEQLSNLPDVSARKMFGDYCLYCGGKPVGLICDDMVFIKITEKGKEFVGDYYEEGTAYKGAKPSMLIDDGRIEDKLWLTELITITADNLPPPKKKKKAQS